jgi:hypothetical protein
MVSKNFKATTITTSKIEAEKLVGELQTFKRSGVYKLLVAKVLDKKNLIWNTPIDTETRRAARNEEVGFIEGIEYCLNGLDKIIEDEFKLWSKRVPS